MGEWVETKLSEIVELIHGFQFRDEDFTESGIPVIKISNVNDGILVFDSITFISNKRKSEFKRYLIENGDILMSLTGNIGRVTEVSEISQPIVQNYRVGKFEPKDGKLNKKFLKYLLSNETLFSQLTIYANQSAQANFGKQDLNKLTVKYPRNITEQSSIATILTTIDQSIEKTEQLIAKYERIKTGLMQDLLTRGIDEQGNIRSEETHEFKDSPLGRIPVEWEYYNLQECCDTIITYGIVQAGEHLEDGVPYIRTGDMSGDFLKKKGLLFTSEKIAKKFERSKVEVGDIVFALRATVGKVLPVPSELSGANLTQGTAKISPKESINEKFILWMLRSDNIVCQIRLVIKGTTFAEISLGNLRKVIIGIPKNKAEQDKIATMLEDINEFILTQKLNLDKLTHQKVALMQDLLTGKVRVNTLIKSNLSAPKTL